MRCIVAKVALFPLLLAAGCIISGAYGVLHDQISYVDGTFHRHSGPQHRPDTTGREGVSYPFIGGFRSSRRYGPGRRAWGACLCLSDRYQAGRLPLGLSSWRDRRSGVRSGRDNAQLQLLGRIHRHPHGVGLPGYRVVAAETEVQLRIPERKRKGPSKAEAQDDQRVVCLLECRLDQKNLRPVVRHLEDNT